MYACACMCAFSMYMHVYMCLEEGNYDNCCRLPNLPASIIWMGNSRKEEEEEEEEKKTVIYFLRFEVRENERERKGAMDEASLLFYYNTVYIVDLQPRWIIQQPWAATTLLGSQFM
jgi:hypothetical protein